MSLPPTGGANADMAALWNGAEGEHWAAHAARYDAAIRPYSTRLLEAAAITAGEAVLDIGAGNGETTLDAARAAGPGGRVLAVDLSGPMLAVARDRAAAAGLANISWARADAQVHRFEPGSFDAAISRFGVMFFADPVAAFANIRSALRPGGRVALIVWREIGRNEWVTALRDALADGRDLPSPPPGAPGPFGLADADRVRGILGDAGFSAVGLAPLAEPFVPAADADDAYAFIGNLGMTRGLLEDLDADARRAALDRLRATIEAHATPTGVVFESSAWLVTARRP